MKKRKNKKIPFLRYLVLAVLALSIGFGVYGVNAERLTGNKVPMPFGVGASVVLSGSMEPTLSVGDLLIVREAEGYLVGDVVVYQSGGMAIVHRILSIDGENAITQGDANNAPDEPIPVETISGRVTTAVPYVGYVVLALKTPIGLAVTIAAAVALVVISGRRDKRSMDEETEKLKEEIRQLMKELKEE